MTNCLRLLFIISLSCFLSACGSTTKVSLTYSQPVGLSQGIPQAAPVIEVGSFDDVRGTSPVHLGAIRDGFGRPMKTLILVAPASEVMNQAFSEGLRSRGMLHQGSGGKYRLTGVIKKLDCSQVVRREAHAEIEIIVTDASRSKRLFSKSYEKHSVSGSALAVDTGLFASVEDLRLLAEQTMQELVNEVLDDPELRNL